MPEKRKMLLTYLLALRFWRNRRLAELLAAQPPRQPISSASCAGSAAITRRRAHSGSGAAPGSI